MIETLLTLIAVLLAVRIVLQIRQGKRAFEKTYCAPSEVQFTFDICSNDPFEIERKAQKRGKAGWELASIQPISEDRTVGCALFFTRKKIKNFLEE